MHTTAKTWQAVKTALQNSLPRETFDLWIEPIGCRRMGTVAELTGPDKFFCSWVADKFKGVIKTALHDHGCPAEDVVFSVDKAAAAPAPAPAQQLNLPTVTPRNTFIRALNPRYIFDEFVVGDCNAVAHTACNALANGDRSLGHCLYISSGTGLGKSHLTHAVAHHVLAANPNARLNYLTAQQLTAEMVRAIRNRKMEAFKDRYQNSDILLMEDVQALSGRAKTQEELALVLDILLESGKTVIFTGPRPPKDITDLDPSLRSRLASGLVTTIDTPDVETRIRITERHAASINLDLGEELTVYVAENMNGDVRQLKSAIVGIKAKSALTGGKPDLDMVREVLSTLVDRRRTMTPEAIRDYVADQFKVKPAALQSKSRKKQITFPRQISMYFSRKYTDCALAEIGRAFNRDHSTVVHAVKVITNAINRQATVRGQVEIIDKKLRKHFEL